MGGVDGRAGNGCVIVAERGMRGEGGIDLRLALPCFRSGLPGE